MAVFAVKFMNENDEIAIGDIEAIFTSYVRLEPR